MPPVSSEIYEPWKYVRLPPTYIFFLLFLRLIIFVFKNIIFSLFFKFLERMNKLNQQNSCSPLQYLFENITEYVLEKLGERCAVVSFFCLFIVCRT